MRRSHCSVPKGREHCRISRGVPATLLIFVCATLAILNTVDGSIAASIPITELLRQSGQDPSAFTVRVRPPDSEAREPYDEEVPGGIPEEYGDYEGFGTSTRRHRKRLNRGRMEEAVSSVLDRLAIEDMIAYIRQMMSCGPGGWCGFNCCTETRRWVPSSTRRSMVVGRRRLKQKRCPLACMPVCTPKCIAYASSSLPYESLSSNTISISPYTSESFARTEPPPIPLCRPSCMPLCLDDCLADPPVTCRHACMPRCTPACVTSPPLMLRCLSSDGCFCPPGYVQCGEDSCCMRYRTMAVRYRDRLPGYVFNDANGTLLTDITLQKVDNETATYIATLRSMNGGAPVNNGTSSSSVNATTLFFVANTNSTEEDYDDEGFLLKALYKAANTTRRLLTSDDFAYLDGTNSSQLFDSLDGEDAAQEDFVSTNKVH